MAFRFGTVTNKEILKINKDAVPTTHTCKRWQKFGLADWQVNLFSVCLTSKYIDEAGQKFFVYKCKLHVRLALLYLPDMFINKHKTQLNGLFTERFCIQKEFTTWNVLTEELNKCPPNFSFVGKETLRPTGYLCAKIETTDSNKWVENHHFCAQLSQCF